MVIPSTLPPKMYAAIWDAQRQSIARMLFSLMTGDSFRWVLVAALAFGFSGSVIVTA